MVHHYTLSFLRMVVGLVATASYPVWLQRGGLGYYIWCKTVAAASYLQFSVGDQDPELDLHVSGPPESGFISQRYGSGFGSFPFLIKVLSELKDCLQNKILTQNFIKNLNF